jgi:hypothetical protein
VQAKKVNLPTSLEKLKEENKALYDIVIGKDAVPSEPS